MSSSAPPPPPHVAFFPCPLQGHITPMLQLASALHSLSPNYLRATIIHPMLNSPNHSNHPHFRFIPIPGTAACADLAGHDRILESLSSITTNCVKPFETMLRDLQRSDDPVRCLIADSVMHFSGVVAEDLGIPWMLVRTSSATSFMIFTAYSLLLEKGYLPVHDIESEAPIVELPPFRVKDLPSSKSDHDHEALFRYVVDMVEAAKKASGLILNTCDALENDALVKLQTFFPACPVYGVGPLCKYSSSSMNSLVEEDRSCITWLDKQSPHSVIYVSIGSLAKVDSSMLAEMARGLAESQQPFLWVVRAGSVLMQSEDVVQHLTLGSWFWEETKGRVLIVSWAPQEEVLAHPAIGGFWSHCGWNSTLESVCAGVPMLCWPSFGDQLVNARVVCEVWRIGLETDRTLDKENVKMGVRRLMTTMCDQKEVGDDHFYKEVRGRVVELQKQVVECVKEDGSSHRMLVKLVDHISSLANSSHQ